MHEECAEIELGLSYYRRLAQARVEILRAEHDRRERGASVGELVADLPRILSEESGRSTIATTRGAPGLPTQPKIELRWPDGREQLVADTSLAHLPAIEPAELTSMIAALEAFERDLSELRARVHTVIDAVAQVIAERRVAGTA
jgi:anti-sigma-K factor RsiG